MGSTLTLRLMMCAATAGSLVLQAHAQTVAPSPTIVRLDPRLDEIVPGDAQLERIAEGISWAEGPVWDRAGGYLLFSDVPRNSILTWEAKEGLSLFRQRSGYSGSAPFTGREPGSNGLTFDSEGRLAFCQHGDRKIGRLEKDWQRDDAG